MRGVEVVKSKSRETMMKEPKRGGAGRQEGRRPRTGNERRKEAQ